jgi:hypothetical protein
MLLLFATGTAFAVLCQLCRTSELLGFFFAGLCFASSAQLKTSTSRCMCTCVCSTCLCVRAFVRTCPLLFTAYPARLHLRKPSLRLPLSSPLHPHVCPPRQSCPRIERKLEQVADVCVCSPPLLLAGRCFTGWPTHMSGLQRWGAALFFGASIGFGVPHLRMLFTIAAWTRGLAFLAAAIVGKSLLGFFARPFTFSQFVRFAACMNGTFAGPSLVCTPRFLHLGHQASAIITVETGAVHYYRCHHRPHTR